jgi:ABC-type Mn2+/Zn2+ transport system ATPase subunit
MSEIIKFEDVVLGYGGKTILPSINLKIETGDFLGIVGPNGAGKTTFLKAILDIIKPISGKIIHQHKLKFGYVPQRESLDELFPLTVRDIVMMAKYPANISFKRINSHEVDEALEKLEIDGISKKLYRDISGGQKQRTLIARALAAKPDVLVLDEPTNGMDMKAEALIMRILKKLNSENLTIIMVTHLLNLVATYAKTVILLNGDVIIGEVDKYITNDKLSAIYKCPVDVITDSSGRKVVIPGEEC